MRESAAQTVALISPTEPRNLIAASILFPSLAFSAELIGHVVGVTDGDTITVLDADKKQQKIRLAGIDAPERKQPFGAKSKQNLSNLVFGKDVAVDWKKRDRNKRIVGKVRLDETGADCAFRSCSKSFDVALKLIRNGMAWHYKQHQVEQTPENRARYAAAEGKARETKAGLWADPAPVPPWEFRKAKR